MASLTHPVATAERALARPLTSRLIVFAVTALACGLGAWAGAWFVPFLVGLAAGALSSGVLTGGFLAARRVRGLVLSAAAGAIAGWAVPLWVLALRGLPSGATARTVAALAGLPPYAGTTIAAALVLAALQVFAAAWLARAIIPGRAASPDPQRNAASDPGTDPQG